MMPKRRHLFILINITRTACFLFSLSLSHSLTHSFTALHIQIEKLTLDIFITFVLCVRLSSVIIHPKWNSMLSLICVKIKFSIFSLIPYWWVEWSTPLFHYVCRSLSLTRKTQFKMYTKMVFILFAILLQKVFFMCMCVCERKSQS